MSGSQGRGAVCQVSEGLQGECRACRRGWPELGGGRGDAEEPFLDLGKHRYGAVSLRNWGKTPGFLA